MVINSVPYSKQILELELALRLSLQYWDTVSCPYNTGILLVSKQLPTNPSPNPT